MNHLDEDAELYALGLTGRERDAEIEAHLAQCDPCRERVIAAESAAASLAAALPPMPAATARRTWWAGLATAAALIFGLTAGYEGIAAHSATTRLARTDGALAVIASSHFGHTTLTSDPGTVAKAIYARDGSWCYVIVSGAPAGAHVVLHTAAGTRDAGALDAGAPATLFVQAPGRPTEIAIVEGGHVFAHGAPHF